MPGPVCTMFLVKQMFPEYALVVENIMEKDAKRRNVDMISTVQAMNCVFKQSLTKLIEQFYDEFAQDQSFISNYGLHIPTVIDDLMDESVRVAVEIVMSLSTSITKKEYIELVFEHISPSYWSQVIAYKVIQFELTGLLIMKTHLKKLQDDMGINYGPIV